MMIEEDGPAILRALSRVDQLRARCHDEPAWAASLAAVKRFQHRRFAATYDDLLRNPAQSAAAQFFLEELYGPHDFSDRDAQFARIVPAMVRLFPREIVATVRRLAELHALSEELDAEMAAVLAQSGDAVPDAVMGDGSALNLRAYVTAWRSVGRTEDRAMQVALMLEVGRALIRYTRNPLLRHSLKLMRSPAKAAGLGALQGFLERGFDTFRQLRDPERFLATVASRESEISNWLFSESDMQDPTAELAWPGSLLHS